MSASWVEVLACIAVLPCSAACLITLCSFSIRAARPSKFSLATRFKAMEGFVLLAPMLGAVLTERTRPVVVGLVSLAAAAEAGFFCAVPFGSDAVQSALYQLAISRPRWLPAERFSMLQLRHPAAQAFS